MKKLVLLFGSLFVTFLIILIAIPFFVDVDKYRPEITQQINQRINGKLELGKLKLSLLGGIKVHAEKIVVKVNGYQRSLLETDRAYLEVPFTSVLSGSPALVAVFDSPKIVVEKNKQGEMNLMKLVPTTTASTATQSEERQPAAANTGATKLPAFVSSAAMGLRITKGFLNYEDAIANAQYSFENLDIDLKNLGLNSTMQLRFEAPMKGKTPELSFGGSLSGEAKITPILVDGAIRSASGFIYIDAGKLGLNVMNNSFVKKEGMNAELKLNFDGTEKDLLLKNLEVKLHDYRIFGKGLFSLAPSLNVRVELQSDPLILDKLADMLPLVSAYKLKGLATMLANIETNGQKTTLNGDLKISEGAFSYDEFLLAPIKYNLQATYSENSIRISKANFSAPDSDLQLLGSVTNFSAPQIQLMLSGKSLNVDKVVAFPEEKTASRSLLIESAFAANDPNAGKVNPLTKMAATNPLLMKMKADATVQVARVTVKGANLDAVNAKATMQNLQLKVSNASFKAFDGNAQATADFDLRSPGMNFSTQGKATKVSAQKAFASYFPKYKNTVEGIADADWNLKGSIYPDTARLSSMNGTVKLNAKDGIFRTVDFKDSIQKVMGKVPFLKNAKAPNLDEGFKSLTSVANIRSGNIDVEPLNIEGRDRGLDIKGKIRIQTDLNHEGTYEIHDPHGVLPKEISKPGAVAFRVTGPLTSPSVDYEYTVKKLVSVAGKAAAKDAVAKGLGKLLGGNNSAAPEGNKDPVKNIGDQLKQKFKLKF